MFLRAHFAEAIAKLTTVDIDEDLIGVAEKFFGFDSSAPVESLVADAYKFVNDLESNSYDLIFFDVNYEEDNVQVSPPLKFFETDFLNKLLESVSSQGGLIAMNIIIPDKNTNKKCLTSVKNLPNCAIFRSKMEEDKNEVVFVARGIDRE